YIYILSPNTFYHNIKIHTIILNRWNLLPPKGELERVNLLCGASQRRRNHSKI
ncbi:hypothetical protein LSH36_701g02000, partial [Paralvinella palmiformis]